MKNKFLGERNTNHGPVARSSTVDLCTTGVKWIAVHRLHWPYLITMTLMTNVVPALYERLLRLGISLTRGWTVGVLYGSMNLVKCSVYYAYANHLTLSNALNNGNSYLLSWFRTASSWTETPRDHHCDGISVYMIRTDFRIEPPTRVNHKPMIKHCMSCVTIVSVVCETSQKFVTSLVRERIIYKWAMWNIETCFRIVVTATSRGQSVCRFMA